MSRDGDLYHYDPCGDTVALECARVFALDGNPQPLVTTMTATSVIMELSSPAKRK